MNIISIDEYRYTLAQQRLNNYLRIKQSPNGGFCSYRNEFVEGSNLADTYYALRTFILMGEEIPYAERVINFLHEFSPMTHPGQLLLYIGSWRCLNPSYTIPDNWSAAIQALTIPPPPRENQTVTAWLDKTLSIVRLKKTIGISIDADLELLPLLHSVYQEDGFGRPANTVDTWLAFQILYECGIAFPDQSQRIVNGFQRLPSGFGITRFANSPRLDSIQAGVGLCLLIGNPILYRREIKSFVLECQCKSGAFAQAPAAAPDIGLSYKALWIMHALTNGDFILW